MFLIGSEMDYSSDKLASRFVFKNPNEKVHVDVVNHLVYKFH